MTGLYAIACRKPQDHLPKRRRGYAAHRLEGLYLYVREESNSAHLGARAGSRIAPRPELVADIASVAGDGEARFFFTELGNRETVEDALRRAIGFPEGGALPAEAEPDVRYRPPGGGGATA